MVKAMAIELQDSFYTCISFGDKDKEMDTVEVFIGFGYEAMDFQLDIDGAKEIIEFLQNEFDL